MGGFVGDLLEGRREAETRFIRGGGTLVHLPNGPGKNRLK